MDFKSNASRSKRALAAAAILSASAAWLGAGAAFADQGFNAPTQDGSLTVHKHVEDEGSQPGTPKGAALEGVEFTTSQVGKGSGDDCQALALNTATDWESINALINDFDGSLPAGYCEVATSVSVKKTDSEGIAKWDALRGIYLVKETNPGPNLIEAPAQPFLVAVPMPETTSGSAEDKWNYDVHAYPKNRLSDFAPNKTVAENNTGTALIPGAEVPWTITVPVPAARFPYTEIKVSDTPAAGLTLAEVTSVMLGEDELASDDYQVDLTEGTITLTEAGLAKVNAVATGEAGAQTNLVVALKTTVDADIDPGSFTNSASATLNGKTKETPMPKTLWGKLIVDKHDKDAAQTKLQKAHFVVYEPQAGGQCAQFAKDSTKVVAEGDTDSHGAWSQVLWIANAQADDTAPKSKDYCLAETVAPAGYALEAKPVKVTLTSGEAAAVSVDFPNVKPTSPDLPLTGAQGTLVMAGVGAALMVAGVSFVAYKRRQDMKAA